MIDLRTLTYIDASAMDSLEVPLTPHSTHLDARSQVQYNHNTTLLPRLRPIHSKPNERIWSHQSDLLYITRFDIELIASIDQSECKQGHSICVSSLVSLSNMLSFHPIATKYLMQYPYSIQRVARSFVRSFTQAARSFIPSDHPRRSVLYMPGSNARAMEKGKTIPADSLIFDLEDAVAINKKV